MRETIDKAVKSITGFFAKLETKVKIRLAILAAVVVVLAIVVAVVLNRTTYATLYSSLDSATAGSIVTELTNLGIDYQTPNTSTILVPEDKVASTRMALAEMGYFSGDFNTSILDSGAGFGVTDYMEQEYSIRQKQADAMKQINMLSKVNSCLVKLNIPQTSSFVLSGSTGKEASAAVTLELAPGATLTDSEVESIASIITGGYDVPIENVHIVDRNGNLYKVGDENTAGGTGAFSAQLELQEQVREKFETQIVNLLSSVYGPGKVKATARVELNFDKETQQKVEFAPPVEDSDEGLVVSMSRMYEYTRDVAAEGVVGTNSNGVADFIEYPIENENEYAYRSIAEEFNYEINETVTQIEKAQATVSSLWISVLIDSETIEEDYTEEVRALVANAIGVNENYMTVQRLPFHGDTYDDEIEAQEKALRDMRISSIIELVIKGVIVVLLVLAILAFLFTLAKGLAPEEPILVTAGALAGETDTSEGIDFLVDERSVQEIDLSAKSDEVLSLEKMIEKDSELVAQLLRNWLAEEE